jgi:3-oxoacyl-[acyl-carrier protein] reductase
MGGGVEIEPLPDSSSTRSDSRRESVMSNLQGKVGIVTGASKGIGAAIAKSLAAAGAAVVVNYASDQKGADTVVAEITQGGGKALAVKGDVSKSADADALVEAAVKQFGRLDILVNNAGVYQFSPLETIDEEHFHRQFNTNVLGLLLTTKAAAKHMGAGASIINIGSVVSDITPPNSAVYSATKASVDAITGALAKELGPRQIRVNALNPGMIETEGTHTAGIIGSDLQQSMIQSTPLGRIGQPGDVAAVAVFLASDSSGWLTGERFRASGGMH